MERDPRIEVGLESDTAHVKVTGPVTAQESPSLREFLRATVGQGCEKFVMWLRDCDEMDSTFVGVLAGLSTANSKVVLNDVSENNRELIDALGLSQMVELKRGSRATCPDLNLLEDVGASKLEKGMLILLAHQTLCSINESNKQRFRGVIEALKGAVKKYSQGSS